jgi:hypothetical protein
LFEDVSSVEAHGTVVSITNSVPIAPAPQDPGHEAQLNQMFPKIAEFLKEFNTHVREYQRLMDTINKDVQHHQQDKSLAVAPLQDQFVKDLIMSQSSLDELAHARRMCLLSPLQIYQVSTYLHGLANVELIIQFFQSELLALLQDESLREYVLLPLDLVL